MEEAAEEELETLRVKTKEINNRGVAGARGCVVTSFCTIVEQACGFS